MSISDLQKWSHLCDVPVERIDSDVGLLIGINVPKAMEPWDIVSSSENGPFAVKKTLLGWVVNGPLGLSPTDEASNRFVKANHIDVQSVPSLEEQMRNQFDHDFNEGTIDDVPQPSREDRQFIDIMTESASIQNGHYVINLPFKSKEAVMPNNIKQAEQRLASLARRLDKDEHFRCEYTKFMDKVIGEGYARKVPLEEIHKDDGHVWYLPHHGVYHPRKHKLRVVFDCAARYRGTSLNDQLLQGPNLTNTLVGTLIRFRQEEIAIMGDIDSMFHQVHVPPQDANFLRFLWWEHGDTRQQASEYQMVVHLFGATSSPSCANFALRKTAHDCKGHFNDEVINTVLKNFYVDDCLKSLKTVNKAKSLVKDLKDVLHRGGFHIAKWISNSREVMSSLPVDERAKEVKDLDLDQDTLPIERALGVQWCIESDIFRFKIVIKDQPLTRRGILSMVSSVYDPLGFLAPFVLTAKVILQELCKLQLGWDDQVPNGFQDQWCLWIKDLQKLSDFKVDRCIKPPGFGDIQSAQLHHFADASETGYGTVSYLRMKNAEGKTHCTFVMGKSRVSPLKQTTIPRLELTAATVAIRTDKMLKDELDISINQTIFWKDSMAVLRYIRNTTARFHKFVANRLALIHEGSDPDDWRYVNTKLNHADFASRGLPADSFLQRKQWIEAPEFLWEEEDSWPEAPSEISKEVIGEDPEVKKVAVRTIISTTPTSESVVDKLINRHSSWHVLKRSVAWILKIRRELRRKVQHKRKGGSDHNEQPTGYHSHHDSDKLASISAQDLDDAENAILSYIQHQSFAVEIDTLRKGRSSVMRTSYIRKLDPVLDNGLLRVGGRLSKSCMPGDSKHPVILPKNHHVSIMIIRQIHHELQHSGRNHMMARLRERYWLVNASSAVR
ncbi:uncharacterized protein LOC117344089 [Pecten maximus]|uniref:uncharacterized protein LOC117344089 n=1 Tax=Pecten maximus TaxID=6579 RepID=UPI001458BFF5|nr:uncharacterized protein LOC117344089 [Pecten maximus]